MTQYAVSYAEALYELAGDEKKDGAILSDLDFVCSLLCENKAYIKLIDTPDITFEEKEKLLDEAFLQCVDKYVLNFLKLLAKNRLFGIVFSCRDEYEKRYNKDNNIEKATVISAKELSENLRSKLNLKLSEMTGKTVVINYETDSTVIGGLVVRFSDTQIDASVRGRLEGLKKLLSA